MKKLVCLFFTSLIALAAMAQDTKVDGQQSKDDGQELIDKFFDVYKNKGYEIALRYAFSTNKWIPSSGDEMDGVIVKLSKQISSMGEYIGYEELRSRSVGTRFRICSYFVYYQRDPLRFLFELYKTDRGWEITNVEFDSNFEKELEQSMKLTGGN